MKHYIECVALFKDGDLRTGEGLACANKLEAVTAFGVAKEAFSVPQEEADVMLDLYLDEALEDTIFIKAEAYERLTRQKLLSSDEYAAMEINQ